MRPGYRRGHAQRIRRPVHEGLLDRPRRRAIGTTTAAVRRAFATSSTSAPDLVTKAYRAKGKGITVVYYAKAPVQFELTVNGAALDNPGLGVQRIPIVLQKDERGFWVIPSNQ